MDINSDGIVLFAKQPGLTSFSSLHSIKKALNTTKVGHTGTLDSFAQGLLVVCTGRLTHLAGNITEFNKSYKAVLKFGSETDTLEYTGNIIKETPLPELDSLKKALLHFSGDIMQVPPAFSAIHIDGKRSSDIARKGKSIELPARPVHIYKTELLDIKTNNEGKVLYALIDFSVSKGTYIRSLARDIGMFCNSSAHLIGLYRTKIGNFDIKDSAGFSLLKDFTIENAINEMDNQLKIIAEKNSLPKEKKIYIPDEKELTLQKEIKNKLQCFTESSALLCGFTNIKLISQDAENDFNNGKPLRSKNFNINLHEINNNTLLSVFNINNQFKGLIEKNSEGRIHYKFVLN